MIEPGPRVRPAPRRTMPNRSWIARSSRDRRRMHGADDGIAAFRGRRARRRRSSLGFIAKRQWTMPVLGPKPQQRPAAVSPARDQASPGIAARASKRGQGRWSPAPGRRSRPDGRAMRPSASSEQPRHVLEPARPAAAADRCRPPAPGEMERTRERSGRDRSAASPPGSPNTSPAAAGSARRRPRAMPSTSGIASSGVAGEGRGHDQEFAHENAERRHADDREHAEHQPPAERRMAGGQPADVGRSAAYP